MKKALVADADDDRKPVLAKLARLLKAAGSLRRSA